MTSLYPSQHGAVVEGEIKHLGETPPLQLSPEVSTLGDILSDAGFRTALFSANPFLSGRFKRGFDVADVSRQTAAQLTEQAIDWLRQDPDHAGFLYLQYIDLHQPVAPPEPYFSFFAVEDGGERGPHHGDWRYGRQEDLTKKTFSRFRDHRIAVYDGALRYVDAEVGRLIEALEAMAILDQTLIVVTSDHGEEFWDHARMGRQLGGDPRGIWGVGHGHSMFEELLRVPWIVAGPGVARGRRIDCDARHLDLAPTLLKRVSLSPPASMLGRDLGTSLTAARQCARAPLIAESPAYGPDSTSIAWRGNKLIVRQDGVKLLFKLRRDPGELNDLAAREPELVAALSAILDRERRAAMARSSEPNSREPFELEEATREQLRALGYLSD